jgi:hypothetical protein
MVREFLVSGGLVEILRRNSHGTLSEPIWLRLLESGQVQFTFLTQPGGVGGAIPPGFAVIEESGSWAVRETQRVAVEQYIVSLGLDEQAARVILNDVGTSRG